MIYVAKMMESLLLFPWDTPLLYEGCLLQTPAAPCLWASILAWTRGKPEMPEGGKVSGCKLQSGFEDSTQSPLPPCWH